MRRYVLTGFCLLLSVFLASTAFALKSGGGGGGGSGNSMSRSPSALEWYTMGSAAADAKKYNDAIQDFTNAIAVKSDYAEAYNMLGYCTRMIGNVTKAFSYYETALKLKPDFPEAREYYGEAWLQQGNLAKAVQQYIILDKAGSKNADELLEKIGTFVNQKS